MTDTIKTILWLGLAIWILALISHDLYIAFWTDSTTYTTDIRRLAAANPMLPTTSGLAAGILIGHFFWWN